MRLQAFHIPHLATKCDSIISPWAAHHAFCRSSLVPYQCPYNFQQTWCAYISIPKFTNLPMMCDLYYSLLKSTIIIIWVRMQFNVTHLKIFNKARKLFERKDFFYEQKSKGTSWKHILYKLNAPGTYSWILTNLKLCTLFDILICKVTPVWT